jgi:hypothetical protein
LTGRGPPSMKTIRQRPPSSWHIPPSRQHVVVQPSPASFYLVIEISKLGQFGAPSAELPPGSSLATPEATPPPPKETASTTPCSPRRRRRMLSADGGGGVPPFFSLLLCPSILYHHSRFVSIRSGRTFTTSRESPSSRRHAHVAVRCWTRPSACVF